jgi:hypothetical protein
MDFHLTRSRLMDAKIQNFACLSYHHCCFTTALPYQQPVAMKVGLQFGIWEAG